MTGGVYSIHGAGVDGAARQGRISVREALQITGWSCRYFYKLVEAGVVHRAEPCAATRKAMYWRAEIVWLNTPPAFRGKHPVTGRE